MLTEDSRFIQLYRCSFPARYLNLGKSLKPSLHTLPPTSILGISACKTPSICMLGCLWTSPKVRDANSSSRSAPIEVPSSWGYQAIELTAKSTPPQDSPQKSIALFYGLPSPSSLNEVIDSPFCISVYVPNPRHNGLADAC